MNNQKYKIALIGSGILSKEIAERAREINIETHCFSFNSKDVACECVDYFHNVNIFDVDAITKICKEVGVTGVIPTTELTILPAARIAKNLNAISNDVVVAKEITNKFLTREKVKNVSSIKQPKYILYVSGELPLIDKYPVIVKPIASGGKRGIRVIFNEEELKPAIENALSFSKVEGVLIEEYLFGGKEYSVEILSYKGKHYVTQITEKDTSGPPYCNELGHHQPAELSEKVEGKIRKALPEMLTCVGITNGPSHTEIKIIDDEIYLIEINDRPGGDHITYPLTELSTGYPYLSGIIYASLGLLEGKEPINLKRYYSGIMFVTDKTPELKNIFDDCDSFGWLYHKNCANKGLSKITFNNEEGLNYFIYFDKERNPMDFIKSYKK